jgi:hypothetical protein
VSDIVQRAQEFATRAHQRINHQRKYTHAPYTDHLAATAKLVATVTDDPVTIAAAWLHDTVEDTPATIQDLQKDFSEEVAQLVLELTDVSTPSEGNRATRKAIDLDHLSNASPRAKTVKLADLINNCTDVTRHDARFAVVYLGEMEALLEVLHEGHPDLYALARKTHSRCSQKVGIKGALPATPIEKELHASQTLFTSMVPRLFIDAFTAKDLATELFSFDTIIPSHEVSAFMEREHLHVVGIRSEGRMIGFVRQDDLDTKLCGDNMRSFKSGQILSGESTIADLIQVLTRHSYCFISVLDSVAGIIMREDFNKPVARMWLFGLVTIIEMYLTETVKDIHGDNGWQSLMTKNRLDKASSLYNERRRRNQNTDLIDCLQLSDKLHILLQNPSFMEQLGFASSRSGKKGAREIESLRNNLAHAQDIVINDWAQIARLSRRVEGLIHGDT